MLVRRTDFGSRHIMAMDGISDRGPAIALSHRCVSAERLPFTSRLVTAQVVAPHPHQVDRATAQAPNLLVFERALFSMWRSRSRAVIYVIHARWRPSLALLSLNMTGHLGGPYTIDISSLSPQMRRSMSPLRARILQGGPCASFVRSGARFLVQVWTVV